jgi:serine/threonine protein kinase/Tol biopolymer transport system component
MSIPAGTRFGPYEILAPLGAGGMGEVYRARDARLGREVAVKVLPAGVSSDPERLKRFEKEARSASSLNHPNIVVVYDIGEAAGTSYIAMELVEGQTIRELLAEGALPTKKVLAIAAQVADGLAKAHGAGIVHRDLKPENIMVTREGFAKILDFGLAKLTQTAGSEHGTKAPTVSGATEPGLVMGTIGYMSPEQALAKPVDFRSDQFSLGSIVYEMATAKRAFSRGSAPETLTAIIRDEPEPIASLAPLTPTPLRWIVERCLSKSPEDRYASTRDLARDLSTLKDRLSEATSSGTLSSAVAAPVRRASKALRASPWVLALLLALGLTWLLSSGSRTKATPAAPLRFSVTLPQGVALSESDIESHSAISPDGRWLVFVGSSLEKERLYLRPVDSLEARPLAGTEGAITPFWSPDSRFIGFFADGKIQRIAVAGGPARIVCDAGIESLPSWGSAGQILFVQLGRENGGLWAVDANGGPPRQVRKVDSPHGENAHVWPFFLPDGRHFLFITVITPADRFRIPLRVGSLDSNETAIVGEVASRVEYSQGHLIHVREGVLLAQEFDVRKLRTTGEPVALADHVYQFNGPLMAAFSASQTGIVVYEPSTRASRVSWLDRAGKEREALPVTGAILSVRLSPDGRSFAMSINDEKKGSADIWTYDFDRRVPVRATLDPRDEKNPVWSADGRSIFFRADWKGPPDIYRVSVGSPESTAPVVERQGVQFPEDVSPDGRFLVFTEFMRRTNGDLWLLPLTGGGKPIPLFQTPFDEKGARFSPDSRWLAYYSNESGSREVYLRPVEESRERLRVSSGGGTMPRWRRDGKELYYLAPDNAVMAVPLSSGRPQPGVATPLFRVEGIVRDYDVATDGQRFLIDIAEPDPAPLSVLANWPSLAAK